jgi:membrane-bound inhibitor of C-type lysozyme
VKQIVEDDMVTATVTDTSGARLDMTFNNTKGTAAFKLNGETIEMKQDTMGSGIKYSNEKYEFTEWHGRIELKKEGKTIFIKSNDN